MNNVENTVYKFGIDIKKDLEILLNKSRELIPNCNEELIKMAFNYCVIAHEGKLRKSGDKFYTHPLSVAFIVLEEIPLDDISVAAALLHNVLDESDIYTYEDIKYSFGTTIAQIVEGANKIKFVESQDIERQDQMDNYRKLLLSLFTDIRIILIKLADKLHNMRTLQYVSPESQIRRATETLAIYAPFANRFGLRNITFELEDLAFKYLNPTEYEHIANTIKGTHKERELYVDKFKQPVIKMLAEEGVLKIHNISYEISGRAKHLYSIYNKTIARQKKVEDIYDIFAIRIILDTDNPLFCFYVYGIIASYYKPIPDTFKDYISNPKPNGYQSLHTAVAGPDNKIVEVQIRTLQMHKAAEVGVAAHFRYKSGISSSESIFDDSNLQAWFDDVRSIFDSIGNESSAKLYQIVSNNMLRDTIYVFTPKDEFKKLPKGATVLDFAFNIHSEIGFSAIGAKVNGKLCSINHVLLSGDKVEVITSKKQKPSPEWIDFVITPRASSKLISYFNNIEKDKINKGKLLWEQKNTEYGFVFSDMEFNAILMEFNFEKANDFYKAIASEAIDIEKVYKFIMLKINNIGKKTRLFKDNKNKVIKNKYYDFNKDKIVFAPCCKPLPDEDIFALLNENNEIIVHSKMCRKYRKILQTNSDIILNIEWKQLSDIPIPIRLHIVATDSDILMQQLISIFIRYEGIKIKNISQDSNNSILYIDFNFDINNNISYKNIIEEIECIENVNSVERIF